MIPRHYFLRNVPPDKIAIVRKCGFVRYTNPDAPDIWAEPPAGIYSGPLAGIMMGDPKGQIERWLLENGIANEIFVTAKWGAEIDP